MRRIGRRTDDAGVNGPVRLVLRVEFEAIAETVEGRVLAADCRAHPFTGWAELFAVLTTLTSDAGGEPAAPDRGQPPAGEPGGATQSTERRKPPC
jgi:hypothetical protein